MSIDGGGGNLIQVSVVSEEGSKSATFSLIYNNDDQRFLDKVTKLCNNVDKFINEG